MALKCRLLVNAAGLTATDVVRSVAGFPTATIPPVRYAKGNYFSLAGRAPFTHLIYPVPVPGGLGVHLTLDLGGQAKFGPDVEWVDAIGYAVDPRRADRFYDAIRRYWPALAEGALLPGYSGIRPKVTGPDGTPTDDFLISGPKDHGVPGVINLFGIESPGLTASLAIADLVAEMAAG
jgi:L-2-hydroxyglutarate oxidase LhgO